MPTEFFYGLPQLRHKGFSVDLLDLNELTPKQNTLRYQWARLKDCHREKQTLMNHCEHLFVDDIDTIFEYDQIIAGTEYIALGLADFLKKDQAPPMIFFAMGMLSKPLLQLPEGHKGRKRAIARYKQLLERSAGGMFLGEPELHNSQRYFPTLTKQMYFSSFGVDTQFWTPKNDNAQGDGYFLFVGNDARRDTTTFLSVVRGMPDQKFIAITSLLDNENNLPANLEIIRGNWKQELITDEQMRKYYQNAHAVVLPIEDTLQPSGQSVALQAMACGKPVVISDFPGFWERGAYRDGEDIILVQPKNSQAMINALQKLTDDSTYAEKVGTNARKLALKHFTIERFADNVIKALDK
ncbi:glycosyltransferase family 4 protein [uncultured Pseudodesulfovibrio sp.]|uniref:glycosyltransferase family 4 protein n=1 Tax=uncultured Pseudodesulfovibrio sp. TaxID=2035858 RepID=UPI0029C897C9|nr:glycosyltransferase family 4 protein [uncultured Pseudodesulfovibrio sp.]